MLRTMIFDVDGIVIHRAMYFSERLAKEFGVSPEVILPFFKKEFQLCVTGQADLKEAVTPYLDRWGWQKSVDELLAYWFAGESDLDQSVLAAIQQLRNGGVRCYFSTDNEKYRLCYILDDLGLKTLGDGVFASAELGCVKSQPAFWAAVHEQLGRPDESTVLVWDDDAENVEAAQQFGFQAALYTDFHSFTHQLKVLL